MMSTPVVAPRLFIGLVLCVLLSSACVSSSPPMRYYLLTPGTGTALPGATLGERTVVVGPLQLPGYLDRPQLVMRLPDGRIGLRELDRWAEPLDAVLTRTLAENLARLTGSQRIVTFPPANRVAADLRVAGRVIRFDTDPAGMAILQVQWSVEDGGGQVLLPVRTAEFSAQATGEEPAALVAALSDALARFAAELAAELVAAAEG
jgi:uncharacterized protein